MKKHDRSNVNSKATVPFPITAKNMPVVGLMAIAA